MDLSGRANFKRPCDLARSCRDGNERCWLSSRWSEAESATGEWAVAGDPKVNARSRQPGQATFGEWTFIGWAIGVSRWCDLETNSFQIRHSDDPNGEPRTSARVRPYVIAHFRGDICNGRSPTASLLGEHR